MCVSCVWVCATAAIWDRPNSSGFLLLHLLLQASGLADFGIAAACAIILGFVLDDSCVRPLCTCICVYSNLFSVLGAVYLCCHNLASEVCQTLYNVSVFLYLSFSLFALHSADMILPQKSGRISAGSLSLSLSRFSRCIPTTAVC